MRKKQRLFPLLLACMLFACLINLYAMNAGAAAKGEVAVYFANWDIHTDSGAQVKNLPWDSIHTVYHAFWEIKPDANGGFPIAAIDLWVDTSKENANAHFPQYKTYHDAYPHVKIMLSIGGWTRSGHFSKMALTTASRKTFIDSCISFLQEYPFFAGIDIDWEYPGVYRAANGNDQGNATWGDDYTNYVLLLKEMRTAMDDTFGQGVKQITVCASGATSTLKKQNYAAISPYVNAINLMTYDFVVASGGVTGHQSAMYGTLSAESAVKYLLSQGVPSGKIRIGTPLYSQSWRLNNVSDNVMYINAAASASRKYREIVSIEKKCVGDGQPGWHSWYDEACGGAILYNNDANSADYGLVLSYESMRSLNEKLSYIQRKNLGGMIVWETGGDTAEYSMIRRMYEAMIN